MRIVNVDEGDCEKGDCTFSSVRKEVLRDEILLISPQNSDTSFEYMRYSDRDEVAIYRKRK